MLSISAFSQKTRLMTVSDLKGAIITGSVTEKDGVLSDTLFIMTALNSKYTRLQEFITVKHGSLSEINNLLTECLNFLSEEKGTSLEFRGNTIMAMGDQKIMLFGVDEDSQGYVILNRSAITRLQADIIKFGK